MVAPATKFTDKDGNIRFVSFLVKRPCLVISLTLGISLLLSIASIYKTYSSSAELFGSPRSDADLHHATSLHADALKLSVDYVKGDGEDGANVDEDDEKDKEVATLSERSGVLLMVFEANSGNVFTPELLTKAKLIQDELVGHPEYPLYCYRDPQTVAMNLTTCAPLISPLNIFYASEWNQQLIDTSVDIIDKTANFSDKTQILLNCIGSLPEEYQSLLTLASTNATVRQNVTSSENMSESDLFVQLQAICPRTSVISSISEALDIYTTVTSLSQMARKFDGKSDTLQDPTKVLELCAALLQVPILKPLVDFFFERDFNSTSLSSKYTRLLVTYGSPLAGYKNTLDREDEQVKAFNDWFQDNFRLLLQIESQDKEFKTYYIVTSLFFDEITSILQTDALLALGSMVFVFGFLAFQTGSFFLATAGMIEIVMSLPLAYAFYSLIFQFAYLGTFCSMCIYIVLAIGADDIFVFMDAYKQSAFEGPEVLKNLESRLSWTYRRAASAMLITSWTTCAAFVATAVSPLATVQSFGIFAAFVIVADFILVITFFPACVVLYHNNMELRGCCAKCVCCSKQEETSTQLYSDMKEMPPKRKLEIFMADQFGPFVTNQKVKILVAFVIWFIIDLIFAIQIEASQAADQFLPSDHPFQRIITIQSDSFAASSQDDFTKASLTWGIESVDRSGVSLLFDAEFLGNPEWDTGFELNEDTQEHILTVCETLVDESFVAREEDNALKASTLCFMEDFKPWAINKGIGFPVAKADVSASLVDFLAAPAIVDNRPTTNARKFKDQIGLIKNTDGNQMELKYVFIEFDTMMSKNSRYSRSYLESEYNKFEAYVKRINSNAPSTGNKMFQTDSERFWVRMRSQEIYITSAITGAVTGTILAFVVILFATQCIRTAFFASLTIVGILLSVLALMVQVGWQLGTIESINITILAGFSVDYVVHLAHAFTVSKATTREKRVHEAIAEIGISVLSGMITSIGASLLLFFCSLQFFAKFGAFLCATIGFSWLWANFFFMALLAIAGPEGEKPKSVIPIHF